MVHIRDGNASQLSSVGSSMGLIGELVGLVGRVGGLVLVGWLVERRGYPACTHSLEMEV